MDSFVCLSMFTDTPQVTNEYFSFFSEARVMKFGETYRTYPGHNYSELSKVPFTVYFQ